jgi:hypothetical protein
MNTDKTGVKRVMVLGRSLLVWFGCGLMGIIGGKADATILTFKITDAGTANDASGSGLNDKLFDTQVTNYGNRVASLVQSNALTFNSNLYDYHYLQGNGFTTNISLQLTANGGNTKTKYYQDGSWPGGVNYLESNDAAADRNFFYTFTPDAGYSVSVNSFDLLSYNFGPHTAAWTLYLGSTNGSVIANGSVSGIANPATPSGVSVNSGFYTSTLVLKVNHSSGSQDAFALDNLNFDQAVAVPEPNAIALLGVTGAIIFFRRNRAASNW